MRTNAWIIIERDRALSWRTWLRWLPEQIGPEPPLTPWERKAVLRGHDMEYVFLGFRRPVILAKTLIMLSVYDVTESELASGYSQLGDAALGGDFGVAGAWRWSPGQSFSAWWPIYPWLPTQALKFMPPTVDQDGIEIPAVGVRDVNLLFGQPPREFPL